MFFSQHATARGPHRHHPGLGAEGGQGGHGRGHGGPAGRLDEVYKYQYLRCYVHINNTVRCDGSTIPHHNGSVWAGQRVPDLNGERRFLRGGADQDVLSLEEDQMEDHGHTVSDPGHTHSYDDNYTSASKCPAYEDQGPGDGHGWAANCAFPSTSASSASGISVTEVNSSNRRGAETRPRNMNIIWIIRVW